MQARALTSIAKSASSMQQRAPSSLDTSGNSSSTSLVDADLRGLDDRQRFIRFAGADSIASSFGNNTGGEPDADSCRFQRSTFPRFVETVLSFSLTVVGSPSVTEPSVMLISWGG